MSKLLAKSTPCRQVRKTNVLLTVAAFAVLSKCLKNSYVSKLPTSFLPSWTAWLKSSRKKLLAFFFFMLYTMQVLLIWLVGQAVKTSPSHGENTGSSPVRAAKVQVELCTRNRVDFTVHSILYNESKEEICQREKNTNQRQRHL